MRRKVDSEVWRMFSTNVTGLHDTMLFCMESIGWCSVGTIVSADNFGP